MGSCSLKTCIPLMVLALAVVLLLMAMDAAKADGPVYTIGVDTPTLDCQLSTRRVPNAAQVEAGKPGDVFPVSEFDHHTLYFTQDVTKVENGTALQLYNCNFAADFTGMAQGQWFAIATTTDTGQRTSARSDPLAFMLQTHTVPLTPPGKPVLKWRTTTAPVPQPTMLFGPVSTPTRYDNTPELQASKRWEIEATLDQVGKNQGLASRDMLGQDASGHLTIKVLTTGLISIRNQGGPGQPSQMIHGTIPVKAGIPFSLVINVEDGLLNAYQDGVLIDTLSEGNALSGNDLSLILGGACEGCKADGADGVGSPVDGVVKMQLFDTVAAPIRVGP